MSAYVLFVMNRLDEDTGEAALTEYRKLGRPAREKYGGIVRVFQETGATFSGPSTILVGQRPGLATARELPACLAALPRPIRQPTGS